MEEEPRTSLNLKLTPQERLVVGSTVLDYTHVDDTIIFAATAEAAKAHTEDLAKFVTRRASLLARPRSQAQSSPS